MNNLDKDLFYHDNQVKKFNIMVSTKNESIDYLRYKLRKAYYEIDDSKEQIFELED